MFDGVMFEKSNVKYRNCNRGSLHCELLITWKLLLINTRH